MSLYAQLKEKRTERKKLGEQTNAIISKAAKEKRLMSPEEEQEWTKRHDQIDAFQKEIEQLEKQLTADEHLAAPAADNRTAGLEDVSHRTTAPEVGEWRAIDPMTGKINLKAPPGINQFEGFRRWIISNHRIEALTDAERLFHLSPGAGDGLSFRSDRAGLFKPEMLETRALSAVTGSAGANTIPQGFVYTLDVALKWYGGIIEAADYIDTTMGNQLPYPSINDTTNLAEQTAENTQLTLATAASTPAQPTYGQVVFNAYMLDSAVIQLPVQLLQDSAFDFESYMTGPSGLLAIRIGRKLNNLATIGSGSNTLTGVVTAAPVGFVGASTTTVSYNELLETEHSVDPAYRPESSWMFNDTTLKAIKKLTDSNSRPLWIAGGVSEGIQNKRPDTIDGYRYFINQDMSNMNNNQKSILFGAFKKFKIRRVRGIEMVKLVERYMDALQIGYIAYQRFDANLVDAGTHPVKAFSNSAT